MKKNVMRMIMVLTMLGLMGAGPVAYAESQGDDPEGGSGYRHGKGQEFFKELNLTPEQQEKLKAQREANKADKQTVREELKTKMQALYAEIAKPGTKREDVNGLVDEVSDLKAQMFAQKIDGVFAMKEVLTPEQFTKMQEQRKAWMEKKRAEWKKNREDKKEADQE